MQAVPQGHVHPAGALPTLAQCSSARVSVVIRITPSGQRTLGSIPKWFTIEQLVTNRTTKTGMHGELKQLGPWP